MYAFKVGDVYFDQEGTFIRIISITDTHVRYAIKYDKEEVYYDDPGYITDIERFPFEVEIMKYIKYTRAGRLLYGKF